MRHILWMKGGALGDFIVGLPTLAALRQTWPHARIEAVGPARWLPLAGGYADRLTPLEDRQWSGLYGEGRELPARLAHFDLAVILRPDPEGSLAENLARAGVARVLVRSPVPDGSGHVVDHNRKILAPLGIESETVPRVLLPDRADRGENDRSPAAGTGADSNAGPLAASETGVDAVYLHPGSGGECKRWPAGGFRQLAGHLRERGLRPVVILGPVEVERGEQAFWLEAPVALRISPPLEALAAELARARLFIGNDSGVSHLAAAVGCPTLALFGPTDPAVWAPRGPRVHVLRGGRLDADPRPDLGGEANARDGAGRACLTLEALPVQTVLDAVDDPRVSMPTTRRKE